MDSNMFTPIEQTIQQKYDGLYPGLLDIIASFYNSHLSGFYMQSQPRLLFLFSYTNNQLFSKSYAYHAREDRPGWMTVTDTALLVLLPQTVGRRILFHSNSI